MADSFNGAVPHLNAHDVTFTCVSRAPMDKIQAYKDRMGWSFPWASSFQSDYNFDRETSNPEETVRGWLAGGVPPIVARNAEMCGTEPLGYMSERPAMSTYAVEDGNVYLTYSTTARGLEFMMDYYAFLDRTAAATKDRPKLGAPPRPVSARRNVLAALDRCPDPEGGSRLSAGW
jgi:predicted dithiol-disulfide oxidoreductase (DUF899 family)